jgi:hypothetical protein
MFDIKLIFCARILRGRRGRDRMVVVFVCFMVFNATFNNISVISWRSVLLVGETCRKSLINKTLYHIHHEANKQTRIPSPWDFEKDAKILFKNICSNTYFHNYVAKIDYFEIDPFVLIKKTTPSINITFGVDVLISRKTQCDKSADVDDWL